MGKVHPAKNWYWLINSKLTISFYLKTNVKLQHEGKIGHSPTKVTRFNSLWLWSALQQDTNEFKVILEKDDLTVTKLKNDHASLFFTYPSLVFTTIKTKPTCFIDSKSIKKNTSRGKKGYRRGERVTLTPWPAARKLQIKKRPSSLTTFVHWGASNCIQARRKSQLAQHKAWELHKKGQQQSNLQELRL